MKNQLILLPTALLLLFLLSGSAIAKDFSVNIEFGPGSANPTGIAQKFIVPSRVYPSIRVELTRRGESGQNLNVPVAISVSPPTGETQTKNMNVSPTPTFFQSISFSGISSEKGCSLNPWVVRLKYADDSNTSNNFMVSGRIVLSYNDERGRFDYDGSNDVTIPAGETRTQNLGTPEGFGNGTLDGIFKWGGKGNMFAEIIRPDGSVADDYGYIADETGGLSKVDPYTYLSRTITGQWKLRIKNRGNASVTGNVYLEFKPECRSDASHVSSLIFPPFKPINGIYQ